MSVDILELDLSSPNVIPDEMIPNLNMLRLEGCTGLREILMALSLSHQRGTLSQMTPYSFKDCLIQKVVHNNYGPPHIPLLWTREIHNFAFWKINMWNVRRQAQELGYPTIDPRHSSELMHIVQYPRC